MNNKKLSKLRALLSEHKYAGYLISTRDEFLSEYAPEYAKRLEYISGFTGSNGLMLILEDKALFFTDGRYLEQAFQEIDDHFFEIFDQQLLPNFPWQDYLKKDQIIAYDPKIFSQRQLSLFKGKNMVGKVQPHKENLIDIIWEEQPSKPSSNIYDYDIEFTGEDYKQKIQKCRDFLAKNGAEAIIITDPDSVCWLLNIRAHDVEFSPLLLANAIVSRETVRLFTNKDRYTNPRKKEIVIHPEEDFEQIVKAISGIILLDKNQCSDYVSSLVPENSYKNIKNPCLLWKAIKNEKEIEQIQTGHIEDAVAVCEILAFIENENISNISEYDISERLTKLRAKGRHYIMDSFPTICGFRENGAIIHYRPRPENAKKLKGEGLLLLDSGGQYFGATTDITRTVCIGEASGEYRQYYTNILKGHIALATSIFPEKKVTGAHLDILARQYLWKDGCDYAHGTGHGVGNFLSVHEGPQNISPAGYNALIEEGMVLSNEPGYYETGRFGIRIENMVYVKKSKKNGFLEFANLTLVPYAKKLIIEELLTREEKFYIKQYYEEIKKLVVPLLSSSAKAWFENECF